MLQALNSDILLSICFKVDISDLHSLLSITLMDFKFIGIHINTILYAKLRDKSKLDLTIFTKEELFKLSKITNCNNTLGSCTNGIDNYKFVSMNHKLYYMNKSETPIFIDYDIIQISCSYNSALFLTKEGRIYTYDTQNDIFDELVISEKIVQVASSGSHWLALTVNGDVYCYGLNDSGQLGLGDKRRRHKLTYISYLHDIINISAGSACSLFVSANGVTYISGYCDGITTLNQEIVYWPIAIPDLGNIKKAVAGYSHLLFLTRDNKVYICATKVGTGRFTTYGNGIHEIIFPVDVEIINIAIGLQHALVLTAKGKVYGWGSNENKQLNLTIPGSDQPILIPLLSEETIIEIAAGDSCTMAISNKNKLYIIGDYRPFWYPVKVSYK